MKKNYKVLSDCRGMIEDEIIDTILNNREVSDRYHFLNPNENDLIPFEELKYIDKARDIVVEGIRENKRFLVFADTDLDGIASGTEMVRFLKHYTENVKWCINQGKAHGLIGQKLDKYKDTDILIIVDSLDKNIEAYKEISDLGIKIIVLDHHDINKNIEYDRYITLVSSQREYSNPALSGSGVVWKFCKYLDEYFLDDYADKLTDLACCGIIADMSDVSETSMENRYICYKGLDAIHNPAIKKIIGSYTFNSTAVSFSIAPLINAANRMSRNESAMNAFLSDDNKDVLKYIKELKQCKEDQNIEVALIMEDVLPQGDKQLDRKVISIFIETDSDIAGLIGNRLLERYQRPLFILRNKEINGDHYYSGSARAVGVEDFRQLCENTGLCDANGHPLAHGVQVKVEDYDEFIEKLEYALRDTEFQVNTLVDIEVNVDDITRDLIDNIKQIDRISGNGFKPIVAKVSGITEYEVGSMSDFKHLVIKPNDYFQFIKWNWQGDFEQMEDNSLLEEPLTLVGTLDSGFIGRNFSLKMICSEVISD